jgi:hypothetical protein
MALTRAKITDADAKPNLESFSGFGNVITKSAGGTPETKTDRTMTPRGI